MAALQHLLSLRAAAPVRLTAGSALVALVVSCSSPTKPTPPTPPAAPAVTCPQPLSLTSKDGKAMEVTFQPPSTTGGSPPVNVSCTPASGASFPIGSTTVTCTATDALTRQATCNFGVTVASPPMLTAGRTLFMAFGDSMTEGKVHTATDFPTSYSRWLQGLLQTRYTAQAPVVVNVAVGGELATTGVTRLPGQLAAVRPQIVLLMEGANDLNGSDGATGTIAAADAVRKMVTLSQAAGAVVFLANLPPQRPGGRNAAGAPFVAGYNDRLRSIAIATGAHFVDVWTAFGGPAASPDLVGPDGLHLTEAGYHKVGDSFFEAIKAQLEVK